MFEKKGAVSHSHHDFCRLSVIPRTARHPPGNLPTAVVSLVLKAFTKDFRVIPMSSRTAGSPSSHVHLTGLN